MSKIAFSEEPVDLLGVADGRPTELFHELWPKLLANVEDPNTHRDSKTQPTRALSITIEVTPDFTQMGTVLEIRVTGGVKLTKPKPAVVYAQLTVEDGRRVAYESLADRRQATILELTQPEEKKNA